MRYLVTSFYGLFHIQTSVKVAGSSYTVRTVYGAVLMLLAILASSLIFHSTTYAAPGDPISIPDANFEACVLDEVTHANPTYVTEAEAAAYNGLLDCGQSGVSSVEGLHFFTAVTVLYLLDNSISDLSPLAGLTNLTYLWIGYNSISDISPLSNLASLTSLLIGGNSISLPSLAWGVSQSNPLKGLDGNPLVPTSSSSAFAYDTLSNSWLFSAGGTYSVAYTQSVTLGSATTTFSGVITQSQEGAAGAIPGVPNTGSFMAFANPIAVAILGLISTIALAYLVHGKKRHNHK